MGKELMPKTKKLFAPEPKNKKAEKKIGCEACKLYEGCITPKIPVYGLGQKKILIISDNPSQREDDIGKPYQGSTGSLLRHTLQKTGLDLKRDCWYINGVRCHSTKITTKHINMCRELLLKDIEELKPEKIIVLGATALQSLLGKRTSITGITRWTGHSIPDQDLGCWVFPMQSPDYIIKNEYNVMAKKVFKKEMIEAVLHKKAFPDNTIKPEQINLITSAYGATIYLEGLLAYPPEHITFDYETTGLKPQMEGHEILCVSFCYGEVSTAFPIFDDVSFKRALRRVLVHPQIKKVAANIQYEDSWTKTLLGYNIKNWHWDTMLGQHILDARSKISGLKFQAYVRYGDIEYGKTIDKYIDKGEKNNNVLNTLKECPLVDLLTYCAMDSYYENKLYLDQVIELTDETGKIGLDLFMKGALEFARTHRTGICVNTNYFLTQDKLLTKQMDRLHKKIMDSEEVKLWDGDKTFNFNSGTQLGKLLFTILKYKSTKVTKNGGKSVDAEALEKLKNKSAFIAHILQWKKLDKMKGTYVAGFIREAVNGKIHTNYMLHTTRSMRGSCQAPNMQNVPVRDEYAQKVIRTGIIPSPGNQIMEVDYSGAEVVVATCYTKDPSLIAYMLDTTSNMHRDVALEIFIREDAPVGNERYLTKNTFVFPEFYGDYYVSCATSLWERMEDQSKEHLATKGISTYRQFEAHIKVIEFKFWKQRFKGYDTWKSVNWEGYVKKGVISSLTGFYYNGIMDRKAASNYAIQGCLQGKSLIQTKEGWIPIKDLLGRSIQTWNGFKWCDSICLDKGEAQIANIYLESGIVLPCDIRHKFKTIENKWIDFKDLQIGERVAMPRLNKRVYWDNKIDWFFVLGFIIGDGWFGQSKSKTNIGGKRHVLSITGGAIKKELLLQIKDFLSNEGFNMRYYVIPACPENNKKEKYKISCEGVKIKEKLEFFGMSINKTAHTKKIPKSVWGATSQEQANFMEGLWLSDGARDPQHNKCLHMCNKELLIEVQKISYGIGYDTFLTKTNDGWMLRFKSVNRKNRTTRKYPKQTLNMALEGREYVWNNTNMPITATRNEYITNKRNIQSYIDINQCIAERIIDECVPDFEIYRYDRVVDIQIMDIQEKTYTMSVNDPLHQFVADGIICKNSSFHCLLWSFITINKWIRKNKLKTKLIGQVHDSLLFDIVPEELAIIKPMIRKVMCEDVRKEYPWLIVPINVDAKISAVDGNWAELEEEKI